MNNKKALLLTTAPLAVILFLTIGLRLALPREDAEADARLRATQQRLAGQTGDAGEGRRRPGVRRRPRPVTFQPADAQTRQAVETAARGQVDAISRGDFEHALSFAPPALRREWTPQEFRTMVEQGFQPMLTGRVVRVERVLAANTEAAYADVVIASKDAQGKPAEWRYRYVLVRDAGDESGATWNISAVGLAPEAETASPPTQSAQSRSVGASKVR